MNTYNVTYLDGDGVKGQTKVKTNSFGKVEKMLSTYGVEIIKIEKEDGGEWE